MHTCPFDTQVRISFKEQNFSIAVVLKLHKGDNIEQIVDAALFSSAVATGTSDTSSRRSIERTQGILPQKYTVPIFLRDQVLSVVQEAVEAELLERRNELMRRSLGIVSPTSSSVDEDDNVIVPSFLVEQSSAAAASSAASECDLSGMYGKLFFATAETQMHLIKIEQSLNTAYRERLKERDMEIERLRAHQSLEMDAVCELDTSQLTEEDESVFSGSSVLDPSSESSRKDITTVVHEHMHQMEQLEQQWKQNLQEFKQALRSQFSKFVQQLCASTFGDGSSLIEPAVMQNTQALSIHEYAYDAEQQLVDTCEAQLIAQIAAKAEADAQRAASSPQLARSTSPSPTALLSAFLGGTGIRRQSLIRRASPLAASGQQQSPSSAATQAQHPSPPPQISAAPMASEALNALFESDHDLMEKIKTLPHQVFSVVLSRAQLQDEDEYYLPVDEEERAAYLARRELERSTRKVNIVIGR